MREIGCGQHETLMTSKSPSNLMGFHLKDPINKKSMKKSKLELLKSFNNCMLFLAYFMLYI